MADNVSIFDLNSSLMVMATSSFDLMGSANFRRGKQRNLYSRLIRGEATKFEVGEVLQFTTDAVVDFATTAPLDPQPFIRDNTNDLSGDDVGQLQIDGVFPSVGGTVFVNNESDSFLNGLYYVDLTGSAGSAARLLRSAGYLEGSVVPAGFIIKVLSGTLNGGRFFTTNTSSVLFGTNFTASLYDPFATPRDPFATPPSWTHLQVGRKDGFVIPLLSSSDHEVSRLNAFSSGSLPLEATAVPASASTYYSKSRRFVTLTYKLSASANLPVTPVTESNPLNQEVAGRANFVANSGSYRNNNWRNPAVFEIVVPERGKIRDVRVWVEFVHDVRTHTGTIGTSPLDETQGLGSVAIALRSPNVNFYSAHPLWNDPSNSKFMLYGTGSSNPDQTIPELLRSSYLLWQGHFMEDTGVVFNPPNSHDDVTTSIPLYADWDSDIDMRTVFCDNSPAPNPRHLDRLYLHASDLGPGISTGSQVGSRCNTISALSSSAPNAVMFSLMGYPIPSPCADWVEDIPGPSTASPDHKTSVQGNNVPWMYDPRIKPGFITGSTSFTSSIGLSPPRGWLSGPANTAALNEFPTTGSQLGPATLAPFYPLLEDLYCIKLTNDELAAEFDNAPFLAKRNASVGFRPGLRGTEVSGRWKLMIGTGNANAAKARSGIWFRQFRLEFVVDMNSETQGFYPSKTFRFKKSGTVSQRPGLKRLALISGSSNFDTGVNYVFSRVDEDHGRSIGITGDAGSSIDSFAVFSQITGSLADRLSGSNDFFLGNEFGTPFIPISSGSGVEPSFSPFTDEEVRRSRIFLDSVMRRSTGVSPAQDLRSTLNRGTYFKTSAELALDLLDSFDRAGLTGSI